MSERAHIPPKTATPAHSNKPAPFGVLQRKCACGGSGSSDGECEDCKKKEMTLQRHASDNSAPTAVPPVVYDVLRSPGQPLDADTRALFEPRFGYDFSKVRIHTDARAAESARAVNALAYTVGPDIVFGAGQYRPGSGGAQQLIAHELSHVVQQSGLHGQLGLPLRINTSGESAADRAALDVTAGRRAGPLGPLGQLGVQRQESQGSQDSLYATLVREHVSLQKSVEETHWTSPQDREQFIQGYLRYTKTHGLWKEYTEAIAAYPTGGRPARPSGTLFPWPPERTSLLAPTPTPGTATLTPRGQSVVPAPASGLTRPSPQPPTTRPESASDSALAEAGLVALARILDGIAKDTGMFRSLYNNGEAKIAAGIASMRVAGKTEAEIARWAAAARTANALEVREASGAVQRKAAELFDRLRGNLERPSYESLRAAGKTDPEIIESALRTNKFVNALPTGLRWTGRALVLLQAGISIYIIVTAPPGQRAQTAAKEGGGFAGGILGGEVAGGGCVVLGIATEGVGLLICGLVGGMAGFEAGRAGGPAILKYEAERVRRLEACEGLSWWKKAFCQMGAGGIAYGP